PRLDPDPEIAGANRGFRAIHRTLQGLVIDRLLRDLGPDAHAPHPGAEGKRGHHLSDGADLDRIVGPHSDTQRGQAPAAAVDDIGPNSTGGDRQTVLREDHRHRADLEGVQTFRGPRFVQRDRHRVPLRRDDDHVEVGEVVRRAVRVVDRFDSCGTPFPSREEAFQVPLADGVRIHARPRLAGEPVRRQADQDLLGPALEGGAQQRLVALVQDVERPSEDDPHRRPIRSARYKRAHGDRRPSWIAIRSEYTANAVWRRPGSRSTIWNSFSMFVRTTSELEVPLTENNGWSGPIASSDTEALTVRPSRHPRASCFTRFPSATASRTASGAKDEMPCRGTRSGRTWPPISTLQRRHALTVASHPSRSIDGSVSANPIRRAASTPSASVRPASISERTRFVVLFRMPSKDSTRAPRSASWNRLNTGAPSITVPSYRNPTRFLRASSRSSR